MFRKYIRRAFWAGLWLGGILGTLFIVNGVFIANNEVPLTGLTGHPARADQSISEIKIMAYNIAKGDLHSGGLKFKDQAVTRKLIDRMAAMINEHNPDLIFLSEAIFECTPAPLNQVQYLARATGMYAWAFGENYNFGLPFFRIVGGNAILSRFPVEALANPSLSGRRPFYATKNSRRVLWCRINISGEEILLASVHNDSFNSANNLVQTRELLEFLGDRQGILAGDFNANPRQPSIKLLRESGKFIAAWDGPATFRKKRRNEKIDFIFAPAGWELLEHRVIESDASDHYPVVSVFRAQKQTHP